VEKIPLFLPALIVFSLTGLLSGPLFQQQSTKVACYSTVHKRGLLLPFTNLLPIPESCFSWSLGSWTRLLQLIPASPTRSLSDLACAHHNATPMSPPLRHNSPNHLNRILQHRSLYLFTNKYPSTTKKRKRKRVRKGTKTPPNHESGRASKLSKPSLLSLFSPFLRSSREEKNLTNFSSFSALVAFSPSPLPQQTQYSVWYPSAKQKTRTNPSFCLVPKRKAKNQRKERLRPLLFPEENPFVCPSVRLSGPVLP